MERRRKGTGSVKKIGKHFYFRSQIGGIEKTIPLKATNRESALKESGKFAAIADAKSMEELALTIGRARKVIEDTLALDLEDCWTAFEQSTKRPECGETQLRNHESHWNAFLAWLPDPHSKIISITPQIAEKYAEHLSDIKKPRTFNVNIKTLRLMFRILLPNNPNPFSGITLKFEDTQGKKSLTETQLLDVLAVVDRTYPLQIMHRDEMKLLFRIAAYTGMRLKDCALIKWDAINEDRTQIAVIPEKTKRASTVAHIPIHPDLLALLPPDRKNGDYIMPQIADRYRRNPSGVDSTVCNIIWWTLEPKHETYKRQGKNAPKLPKPIKGYGAHSFRHAFISFCANAGVPLEIVKSIVGHANVEITRIYSHISDESRRMILDALPSGNADEWDWTDQDKLKTIEQLLQSQPTLTALKKKILQIVKG